MSRSLCVAVLLLQIVAAARSSEATSITNVDLGLSPRLRSEAEGLLVRGTLALSQKSYDEAIEHFSQLIRLDPSLARAYSARGYAYDRKDDRVRAFADYSKAIELLTSDPSVYVSRADIHLSRGDYRKAVADCSQALRLVPGYCHAYERRAIAHQHEGNWSNAIADCTEAIRLDPKAAAPYCIRGSAYRATGELDEAIADCTEAIRLDPKAATPYSIRGGAYHAKGEWAKAIADCSAAVGCNSDSARACNNLAWLLAVCPDATLRDDKKAIEWARKACELNGWEGPYYLGTYAAACAAIGNFDEAVTWQRKSLESGLPELEAERARQRLRLYEQRKPFREEPREAEMATSRDGP